MGWNIYTEIKIMNSKGNILWVDDEIDLLKPHIMYLENKGYNVVPVHSGEDAIHLTKEDSFDLVLLDEMMTGLDGLTTLKYIKEINPNLPIIMITKNEEESLMEEAIASHITNYLTKPVNPSQILIACKNVLETKKIQSDSAAQGYLKDFQDIGKKISAAEKLEDWYEINHHLTDWMVRFDSLGDQGLGEILSEQHSEANRRFSTFIENEYEKLIAENSSAITSPKILDEYVRPHLDVNRDGLNILKNKLQAAAFKIEQKKSAYSRELGYLIARA